MQPERGVCRQFAVGPENEDVRPRKQNPTTHEKEEKRDEKDPFSWLASFHIPQNDHHRSFGSACVRPAFGRCRGAGERIGAVHPGRYLDPHKVCEALWGIGTQSRYRLLSGQSRHRFDRPGCRCPRTEIRSRRDSSVSKRMAGCGPCSAA